MFSDILTPLPALGCAASRARARASGLTPRLVASIDFDVVRGKGPVIPVPIRTKEQVAALRPMEARCAASRSVVRR